MSTRRTTSKGAAQAAPTLDELGALIHEESKQAEEADLARAIRLGGMLRQAKGQVPRGGWRIWLGKNYVGHFTNATNYMRLADPKNVERALHCKSVREALVAIRKQKTTTTPKRKPREAGKRLRALHAQKREKDSNLLIARVDIVKMVGILESVDLPALGFGDAAEETVQEIHDELCVLFDWLDRSLRVATAELSQQHLAEKVRKLREGTAGRSPEEIATAHRLAERLERKRLKAV
jgi:hypothetical protein